MSNLNLPPIASGLVATACRMHAAALDDCATEIERTLGLRPEAHAEIERVTIMLRRTEAEQLRDVAQILDPR